MQFSTVIKINPNLDLVWILDISKKLETCTNTRKRCKTQKLKCFLLDLLFADEYKKNSLRTNRAKI